MIDIIGFQKKWPDCSVTTVYCVTAIGTLCMKYSQDTQVFHIHLSYTNLGFPPELNTNSIHYPNIGTQAKKYSHFIWQAGYGVY